MIREHYPGNIQLLLRWASNRNSGKQDRHPPEPFKSWITKLMPENCRHHMGWWVGVGTPDAKLSEDGEWLDRFPHRHIDSMGWPPETITLMTYLSVPLEGGEIAVGGLSKDDPYEEIMPEVGMTLGVDALIWHGVRPIKEGTRIVLLTTGMPEGATPS